MNRRQLPILISICLAILVSGIAVFCVYDGLILHPKRPARTLTQDAFINLSQLQESTKDIKVVLVDPFSFRVIGLTKEDFNQDENFDNNGNCSFVARQPSQITKIYEILRSADLHAPSESKQRYEPNEAIFIRLKNGELEKFFFERHYANVEWATGEYNNTPILASPTLIYDLYEWAAIANPNLPCVEYLNAARRTW